MWTSLNVKTLYDQSNCIPVDTLLTYMPVYTYDQAFMKTWRAACDFNGIATMVVPPGVFTLGETVFQGPCRSPPLSPITVQVQGTMKAVADPSEYSDKSWISFEHVNGLVITGPGTIDGSGPDVWKFNDCQHNSNCDLLPAVSSIIFINISFR